MKKLFYIGLFLFPLVAGGQDDQPRNWTLSGYIKNLENGFFFNNAFDDGDPGQLVDTFLIDNLIHNRLNFRWFIRPELNFYADLRTRVFFGDLVRATPDYADLVDNANNDYLDLSLILLDQEAWVMHMMLDRLYLEYIKGNWEVRLGRQRVNWGISTVWNPNDIFNAFAFTDFDYEERPGSDALRIRHYTGFASSVELAVKLFDQFDDEAVIAGLWRFHEGEYDFQILAAKAGRDLALGGGWAGNLKDAGFKGEFTYFHSLKGDEEHNFAATLGVDYVFTNTFYLNTGFLYNSNGATDADISELFNFELSAKNLYPYRYALFAQWSYAFTPLLTGGTAFIYSPGKAHALFINPTLNLSIKENWDLDLVGQFVFNNDDGYTSPVQAFFLRLKYSF